jgi:hypothetical protein
MKSENRKIAPMLSTIGLVMMTVAGFPSGVNAESTRSTAMWGTANSAEVTMDWRSSAEFHTTGGVSAGQVNAARKGVLYSGPNMTVIGSQTIVQVSGNNNIVQDIDQSAVNSGDQSLDAPIN